MSALLLLLFFAQIGTRNDIAELRGFLGLNLSSVMDRLESKNQVLLQNTDRLAPAQAAEMRARWKRTTAMPAERPIVAVGINDIGQGLVSFLFDDDFIAEQVNFVFCPPQPAMRMNDMELPAYGERVLAVQVLFDDTRAAAGTVEIFGNVYQLPRSVSVPPYEPALAYPLRPNLPVTYWDLGSVEAVYQPIAGGGLITGQLWLADKTVVRSCAGIPRIKP